MNMLHFLPPPTAITRFNNRFSVARWRHLAALADTGRSVKAQRRRDTWGEGRYAGTADVTQIISSRLLVWNQIRPEQASKPLRRESEVWTSVWLSFIFIIAVDFLDFLYFSDCTDC